MFYHKNVFISFSLLTLKKLFLMKNNFLSLPQNLGFQLMCWNKTL
jgi:hypothetical protein